MRNSVSFIFRVEHIRHPQRLLADRAMMVGNHEPLYTVGVRRPRVTPAVIVSDVMWSSQGSAEAGKCFY